MERLHIVGVKRLLLGEGRLGRGLIRQSKAQHLFTSAGTHMYAQW
jgi:hypothetical protein